MEKGYDGVNWMQVTLVSVQWQALVKTGENLGLGCLRT